VTSPHEYDADGLTARQITPLTCRAVADWCGGQVSVDANGNQGVDLDGTRADYGDWVVRSADVDTFTVHGPVEFRHEYLEA